MTRELLCRKCGSLLATLRDASVRKDIVCYCKKCDPSNPPRIPINTDVPDFLKSLFR